MRSSFDVLVPVMFLNYHKYSNTFSSSSTLPTLWFDRINVLFAFVYLIFREHSFIVIGSSVQIACTTDSSLFSYLIILLLSVIRTGASILNNIIICDSYGSFILNNIRIFVRTNSSFDWKLCIFVRTNSSFDRKLLSHQFSV